jgi:serine/threonine-protein kinase RsbW
MTLLKSSRLRVNTDIYTIGKVQEWFEQFSEIPHQVWMQCNLVLVEGFTNVVCHAHEHLPETTPVDLEVILFEDAVEIRVWDFGQPFDLQKALAEKKEHQPQPPISIDDLDTGGRGLLITDKVADLFTYERLSDGRNCLLIRKQFTSVSADAIAY